MAFDPKTYWEERLEKSFGLHGTGHIALGKCFNTWMYRVRGAILRRSLCRLSYSTQNRFLDIGSGSGFYLSELKKLGVADVTSMDLTSVSVARLKEKFPGIAIHELDISSKEGLAKLSLGEFDFILCFDVLFHIIDDEKLDQAIGNIGSLMRTGGHFLLSDTFIHAPTRKSVHHVNRNIDEFIALLKKHGFEIQERRPTFCLMNEPVDTDSRFLKLFWRVVSKLVKKGEIFGYLVGLCLYPFELLLHSLLKEGPSTEIMICRKAREAGAV